MSITTSQQISNWYELYKAIDVTFTKEIIKATGFEPRHVYLKCVGEQWPCVIYSTSFAGAKIVASAKPALLEKLKRANNLVSLRFSFRLEEKSDPVSFFITGRATGFSPYSQGGGDLQFMNIEYTQRPPDDLIDIMGKLLEANINSTRRREERILLSPDAMRRINVLSKNSVIFVQGVPRKCILRDLSFSGVKIIIVGLAKFLVGKECFIRLEMDEPREIIDIKGKIVRHEDVEGRKDLAAVAIHFDDDSVPMSYKMHINDYLSQTRQGSRDDAFDPKKDEAAPPAQPEPGQGAAHGK
jgi:Tfp pilus assembly protein PilZ